MADITLTTDTEAFCAGTLTLTQADTLVSSLNVDQWGGVYIVNGATPLSLPTADVAVRISTYTAIIGYGGGMAAVAGGQAAGLFLQDDGVYMLSLSVSFTGSSSTVTSFYLGDPFGVEIPGSRLTRTIGNGTDIEHASIAQVPCIVSEPVNYSVWATTPENTKEVTIVNLTLSAFRIGPNNP